MIENFWLNAFYSVTPTILIGLIFWFIMRSILRADRGERDTYAKIEQEERAKRGLGETEGSSELLDQGKQDGLADAQPREGHQ